MLNRNYQTLRIVLGDQLSDSLSALQDINKETDLVLMMEVKDEITYVRHHKKKIVFVLSSMRHFAQQLLQTGHSVHYVALDDPDNTGCINGEVKRIADRFKNATLVFTEPSEYRVLELIKDIRQDGYPVEIRQDKRFLCTQADFKKWHANASARQMEYFYRHLRKQKNILMESDGTPSGNQWNFDKENRARPPKNLSIPPMPVFSPDSISLEVIKAVNDHFSDHLGSTDGFNFAVTRKEALFALECFINDRLDNFGKYQDIMQSGEAFLYHSMLSSYINIGLLLPDEVCLAAEKAWKSGKVPINSAEGFIRQIIGWREYVRGIYWMEMPEYQNMNFFGANHSLPEFYWNANTDMACLRECVSQTIHHAYSHHIQRLMVTGNFALLTGIDPKEVCEWYLAVYADAFEWVELPNTLGMALYGDGGIMASKPYAASGKYINKMSNFCKSCIYHPDHLAENDACPFNYLYWNFINTHLKSLRKNPRMSMMTALWDKMDQKKKDIIMKKSARFLKTLEKA